MKNIKVAIIHGEKCLEVFCELFPEATLFTLLHKKGSVSSIIENMDIHTSFLQGIPGIAGMYRNFLPLFPKAIESFDLSGYDLVISSSHCVAKGAKKADEALHICYCYTPVRYAWEFFDEYFSEGNFLKRHFISRILNGLKKWDLDANKRVDYFVAISDNIRGRIKKHYGISSDVIYPPVDTETVPGEAKDEGYYLVVSALVPYKRVDLAVKAFKENKSKLVIIGSGPDTDDLKNNLSDNENIEFSGWVDEQDLKKYYAGCKALIFPGEEDVGIVPVEAQAFGKPVIAYGAGGVLETVIPFSAEKEDATGVFFNRQTVESLNGAIGLFEKNSDKFDPERIKRNAGRFNRERFKEEIREYIKDKWERHTEL